MEEDVLERTSTNECTRGRDAGRVHLTECVVAVVDVQEDPIGQHFYAIRELRELIDVLFVIVGGEAQLDDFAR